MLNFRPWKVLDIHPRGTILQILVVNGSQKLLHWTPKKAQDDVGCMVETKGGEYISNFLVWMQELVLRLHHNPVVKAMFHFKTIDPRFDFRLIKAFDLWYANTKIGLIIQYNSFIKKDQDRCTLRMILVMCSFVEYGNAPSWK